MFIRLEDGEASKLRDPQGFISCQHPRNEFVHFAMLTSVLSPPSGSPLKHCHKALPLEKVYPQEADWRVTPGIRQTLQHLRDSMHSTLAIENMFNKCRR
eukprot:2489178-Amphidinium_carterae.1